MLNVKRVNGSSFTALRAAMVLTVVVSAGCQTVYTVEMKAEGERVERKSSSARSDRPDDRTQISEGGFTGATPGDIGGAGSYTFYKSNLGTAAVYVERFRGNADLVGQFEKLDAAADELADMVIDYLRSQLGGEAGWEKLRVFLDTELRRDLKNVARYAWAVRAEHAGDEGDAYATNLLTRVGAYLVERGYFTPEQIPTWVRYSTMDDESDLKTAEEVAVFYRAWLGRAMGLSESDVTPDRFGFLRDAATAKRSIEMWYAGSELRKRQMDEWQKRQAAEPDAEIAEPGYGDLFSEYVEVAFGQGFGSEAFDVRFAHREKPVFTNGKWDAAEKKVTWRLSGGGEVSLPAFAQAVWAEADESAQMRLLGGVKLTGQELLGYVLWYEGLTEQERGEWDGVVNGLRPGDEGSIERLKAFQFTGVAAGTTPEKLVETGRDALLGALGVETEEAP